MTQYSSISRYDGNILITLKAPDKNAHTYIYIYRYINIQMRHILTHSNSLTHYSQLHTFSTALRSAIKSKAHALKNYDNLNTLQFQTHLRTILLHSQNYHNNQIATIINKYKQISLTAAKPTHEILKEFLLHSKKYSEEDLVQTILYFSRIYQVSFMDANGKLDLNAQKLFENPDFDHLIEEVKFGLSPNAYMSFESVVTVLEALTAMRYPDMEIIKLVMLKIEKFLDISSEERGNFSIRYFQAQKKGYYKGVTSFINNPMAVEKALLENPQFLSNLSYFEEKKKSLLEETPHQNIKEELESQENYNNLLALLENFDKFNKGAEHFIEAIISIRQQYAKLCTISKEFKVLRNPTLNYNLLELEEKLLEASLIDIQDVKNPQRIIENEAEEFERVEDVLKLVSERFGFSDFQDLLVSGAKVQTRSTFGSDGSKKTSEVAKNRKDKEIYLFSKMVSSLAKYCTLQNRLHGTQDKVSLLNVKWQRYFLDRSSAADTLSTQNSLNVEKIFLKSFAQAHLFMNEHLPLMEFSLMGGSIRSKVYWFNGLLEMGYTRDIIEQLRSMTLSPETISAPSQPLHSFTANSLSNQEFLLLVKILNNCGFNFSLPANIQISQLTHQQILKRIEQLSTSCSQVTMTYSELSDCINYMYQYRPSGMEEEEAQLYKNLVDRLYEQVRKYEKFDNAGSVYGSTGEMREAYRILQFQKFGNNIGEGLLQALMKMSEESEELGISNPYYQAIHELLSQLYRANKSGEMKKLPFFLTGVSSGEQTGVYLVGSNNSSLDGEHISGNISAYCLRIKQFVGVRVTPISINQFMEIQYSNNGSTSLNNNKQELFSSPSLLGANNESPSLSGANKEQNLTTSNPPQTNNATVYNTNVIKPTLKLMPTQEIVRIIQKTVQSETTSSLNNFIKILTVTVPSLATLPPNKVYKILGSLKNISLLHRQENSQTAMLSVKEIYGRRAQLLMGLDMLKRDLKTVFNKEENTQIYNLYMENYENIIQSTVTPTATNLVQVIEELEQSLEQQLPARKQRMSKISTTLEGTTALEHILLKGRRLTIDTFPEQEQPTTTSSINELVDQTYLLDTRYVEYQDWRDLLIQNTNYREINISDSNLQDPTSSGRLYSQEVSNVTKLLARRYCAHSKEIIVATPLENMLTPKYPADWRTTYRNGQANVVDKGSQLNRQEVGDVIEEVSDSNRQVKRQQQTDEQIFIVNLQNFKHELKCTKKPEQICEYILSFNFIDQVLLPGQMSNETNENEESKAHFLKRSAQEYFNYLEIKHDKLYLQSPYLEYIFNKIEFTEDYKQKIEDRKTTKVRLQALYQKGEINRKQYFDMVKKIDEKLIAQMKKGLKKKLVGHTNGINLLEDPRKIVQLEKDVGELERIIKGARFYDQNLDEDLIQANGDHSLALQIKRSKSERNLILYKIYYKTVVKGEKLNSQESKFLDKWKKEYVDYLGCKSRSMTTNYTKHSLKKMPAEDKEKIILQNTNIIRKCSDLSINDLVLELNHFFDEGVIGKMEAVLYAEHLSQKKLIPYDIVLQKSSNPKQFSSISNKIEQDIFDESAKMSEKELEQLISLTKVFKTEAVTSSYNYHTTYFKNIKQELQQINQVKSHKLRTPLMKQFLKCKDYEFYNKYLPQDVKEIKEKQVEKIFTALFEKEDGSKSLSSFEIRRKVDEICRKMAAIRMNVPAYFGCFVLEVLAHEKTDAMTKQKLIAYLQIFKVPLELDSSDILSLVQQDASQKSRQSLMKQLKKISLSSPVENQKMQELLL